MKWDSMQRLCFILLVEEKFDYVVDGSEVGKAKTVNDLVALVGDLIEE
jgi:acyl carrier protein